ncbi:hypothetical protein E2542_SST17645 [Spatholobus suberectus]|nr:hypothetical protein E2542_SST17645 [Spatholobus suberectus]
MAEIQPPEGQINGGRTLVLHSSEPSIGSKRQRRPSVRLGDIGGDQPYDSHARRNAKPWKLAFDNHQHQHRSNKDKDPGKPSKTRPLTNLSEFNETLEPNTDRDVGNIDTVAIGSWKVKESKRRGSVATKRVRSNWVSRIDGDGDGGGGGGNGEGEEKYNEDGDGDDDDDGDDDGYREFEVENSESLLKEQSPIHSVENLGGDGHRRAFKGSREREQHHDGVELSAPSDTDVRDWKRGDRNNNNNNNNNENGGGRVRGGEDGVRVWLNGLGLGRYAPVLKCMRWMMRSSERASPELSDMSLFLALPPEAGRRFSAGANSDASV